MIYANGTAHIVDPDFHRKLRISKFLQNLWSTGGRTDNAAELLLRFDKYLGQQEEERQRA